jgi:hypothetical protein
MLMGHSPPTYSCTVQCGKGHELALVCTLLSVKKCIVAIHFNQQAERERERERVVLHKKVTSPTNV